MSKILAIDTSNNCCSAALNNNGEVTSLLSNQERQHAKQLLPMISELLAEAGLAIADLDAIAVVSGPGSFTGLRIGGGVAQGLAFGANIPVVGVSTLAVMAMKAHRRTGNIKFLVCLGAREDEVYSGAYLIEGDEVLLVGTEQVGKLSASCFSAIDVPSEWSGVGDGWQSADQLGVGEKLKLTISDLKDCSSDAETLSIVAQFRFERGLVTMPHEALPVYLKEQMGYKE